MDTATYLSLDALASALGLPRRYLREQAERGTIPSLKVGGRLRFEETAVREALRKAAQRRGRGHHGK
jgi:excisionase family DNA binding protein